MLPTHIVTALSSVLCLKETPQNLDWLLAMRLAAWPSGLVRPGLFVNVERGLDRKNILNPCSVQLKEVQSIAKASSQPQRTWKLVCLRTQQCALWLQQCRVSVVMSCGTCVCGARLSVVSRSCACIANNPYYGIAGKGTTVS